MLKAAVATRVRRRSASVIKVDVAYVNVRVSRCLRAIDKWATGYYTINMLFKTVVPLRN